MSAPSVFPPAAAPSVWRMYRAMVGVGLACGLLIVTVYQLTLPTIERNKAEALERAIFRVLPDARSTTAWLYAEDAGFTSAGPAADHAALYAGLDADGNVVGFAIPAQGMGYQDVIRVIYGYSFERDAIVGLQVLESKETPGLGDRIASDPVFTANFERLDVSLTADGAAVANPIVAVKHGQKEHPWQIDGITGATISSVAIADLLRESSEYWIPRLRANLARLREGAPS